MDGNRREIFKAEVYIPVLVLRNNLTKATPMIKSIKVN